jgi:hypothetical protein
VGGKYPNVPENPQVTYLLTAPVHPGTTLV